MVRFLSKENVRGREEENEDWKLCVDIKSDRHCGEQSYLFIPTCNANDIVCNFHLEYWLDLPV
jgi:hypothetical protein